MNRQSDIRKIKRYLKKNGMILKDIGVEESFRNITDETIYSILDDINEDQAREDYDNYLAEESFNNMLEEEEYE